MMLGRDNTNSDASKVQGDSIDQATQDRLADAVDQYLLDLQQGRTPSLDELAAADPQLAELLPEYLEGVRMIHEAMDPDEAMPLSAASPAAAPGLSSAAAAALTDQPPQSPQRKRVGDYELIRELGRGGMGIVYEARQTSLNRLVALKMLPFAAVLDERQIARFRTEAQAAAGLHHANIVPVFAVGQERGVHFYAMQYVEGQSLSQAIDELRSNESLARDRPYPEASPTATTADALAAGPLSTVGTIRESAYFRKVAELGIQAAEALQHAHDFGVVHRDIKPSNLLLDQRGKLWVTDFGLARVQSEMSVTLPGDVIGTLRYMSPEQARGRSDLVDGRTDVYSLGATLYEMVCLQPAYPSDDQHALLERIQSADPPTPRRLNPAAPVDLETIILRAMEKSREDRYNTAGQLAEDLRRYLDGRPTIARRPNLLERAGKWVARRRGVALASAAAMFLVTIISLASALAISAAGRQTKEALAASEASRALAETHYQQARNVVDHFGADLADRLADLPGAEQLRRELLFDTLGYYESFQQSAAGDESLSNDLAAAYFKSAAITQRLGDPARARQGYQRAVEAWRQMVVVEEDAASKASLVVGLSALARVESELEEFSAAATHFEEAIQIGLALAQQQPQDAQRAAAVAELFANQGAMLRRTNDTANAAEQIQQAIGWLQVALKIAPDNPQAIRKLAVANSNLSDVLRENSPDDAFAASQRAVEAMQRLVTNHPDVGSRRADLAMALNNLAALQASRGDWRQAGEGYLQASNEIAELVRRNPLIPRHRRELAITQSNLGLALARLGEHQESDAAFDVAMETLQSLAADFPDQPVYQSSLAALLNNRGVALRVSGRAEESAQAFAQAIDLQEQLLTATQPSPSRLAALERQYRNYADALRSAEQFDLLRAFEHKRRAISTADQQLDTAAPVDSHPASTP